MPSGGHPSEEDASHLRGLGASLAEQDRGRGLWITQRPEKKVLRSDLPVVQREGLSERVLACSLCMGTELYVAAHSAVDARCRRLRRLEGAGSKSGLDGAAG